MESSQGQVVSTQDHLHANLLLTAKNSGYSIDQIAALAGLNPQTVRNWMHGTSTPTLRALESVAETVGVAVWELVLPADRFRELLEERYPAPKAGAGAPAPRRVRLASISGSGLSDNTLPAASANINGAKRNLLLPPPDVQKRRTHKRTQSRRAAA